MPGAAIDLKSLLEQSRQLSLDTLETSRALVLELKASHYWTVFSLETFGQLGSIGRNIERMLGECQPHWQEKARIFERPEAQKLWRTAVGFWRALPKVRKRFSEQLARRRRRRIMGEEIEETEDLDPEVLAEELKQFNKQHDAVLKLFEGLAEAVAAVPPGLVPEVKPEASPDGQLPPTEPQAPPPPQARQPAPAQAPRATDQPPADPPGGVAGPSDEDEGLSPI